MRPLILVTNDDSIHSEGIRALVNIVKPFGDVLVVAPDTHMSGMSHAITVNHLLRVKKSKVIADVEAYECSGTPADCVKMAKHELAKNRKIDLVVSGVNHGLNASISVIYSGTMAAVMEAAIEGIPAIGFSIDDLTAKPDFSHIVPHASFIIKKVLDGELGTTPILNVNFPAKSDGPILGIKVVRQNKGNWVETFEKRSDPNGKSYYWMGGGFENREPENTENDVWAVENNFTAVVPVQYDFTNYGALKHTSEVLMLNA